MTDITHSIDRYINYQNQDLWEELNKDYDFILTHDPLEYSWLVNIKGRRAEVVCNELDINLSAFSHELLHVRLDQFGMTTYDELDSLMMRNPDFNNYIFRTLIYQIYNFHSHKKMYPMFKKMGFEDKDFVSQRKLPSFKSRMRIWVFLRLKRFRLFGVEEFFGTFFALRNDFVQDEQDLVYKKIRKMRRINRELYDIAFKFDDNWDKSDDLNYVNYLNEFLTDVRMYLGDS